MIEFIERGIPHKICPSFGFCDTVKKPRRPILNSYRTSTANDVCVGAVEFVRKNRNADAVANYCETLSGSTAALCLTVAHGQHAKVVSALNDGLNSMEICGKLGFPALEKTKGKKSANCPTCLGMLRFVKLASDRGLKGLEMKDEIGRHCAKFAASQRAVCEGIVAGSLDEVGRKIEEGVKDREICTGLGYCVSR
jgi:hypothetical protein